MTKLWLALERGGGGLSFPRRARGMYQQDVGQRAPNVVFKFYPKCPWLIAVYILHRPWPDTVLPAFSEDRKIVIPRYWWKLVLPYVQACQNHQYSGLRRGIVWSGSGYLTSGNLSMRANIGVCPTHTCCLMFKHLHDLSLMLDAPRSLQTRRGQSSLL